MSSNSNRALRPLAVACLASLIVGCGSSNTSISGTPGFQGVVVESPRPKTPVLQRLEMPPGSG